MPIKQLCIRRVKGERCQTPARKFCQKHNNTKCSTCREREAVFECRTCDKPLCATCQCHDSFGH